VDDEICSNEWATGFLVKNELHNEWSMHRGLCLIKHAKIHLLANEVHDIKRGHWRAIFTIVVDAVRVVKEIHQGTANVILIARSGDNVLPEDAKQNVVE
jgi:hypothetical protein